MPQLRAPKGGITIQGTFFPGGQFIPDEAFDAASDEQKAQIVAANQEETPQQAPAQTWPQQQAINATTVPTYAQNVTIITPAARQQLNQVPVMKHSPDESIVAPEQLEEMIALGLQGYKAANGNVFEPIDPQREQAVIQRAIQLANTPVKEYHRIRGKIYENARAATKTDEDIINYRAARLVDAYIGYRNRKLAHSSALHGYRAVAPKTIDASMNIVGKTLSHIIERPQTVVNNVNKSPLKASVARIVSQSIGGPKEIKNINNVPANQKVQAYTSLAISESIGKLASLAIQAAVAQGIPMLIRHLMWKKELRTARSFVNSQGNANLNIQLPSATPTYAPGQQHFGRPVTSQQQQKPITYQDEEQQDPISVIQDFLAEELDELITQVEQKTGQSLTPEQKQKAIGIAIHIITPAIIEQLQKYSTQGNQTTNVPTANNQTPPTQQPTAPNTPITSQMNQPPQQYQLPPALIPPSGPCSPFNPFARHNNTIERIAQSFWPQPTNAIPMWLISLIQRAMRISLPTSWLDRLPDNCEAINIQKQLEQQFPDSVIIARGPRDNHQIICGRHIIMAAKQTRQPNLRTIILQGGGLIPMAKGKNARQYGAGSASEPGHNQILEMLSNQQNEMRDEELLPDGLVNI